MILSDYTKYIFSLGRLCIYMVTFGLLANSQILFSQDLMQSIDLETGWNAVAFEVYPQDTNPEILFGDNESIREVVAFIPSSISSSFLRDPGEELRNNSSWARWRREGSGAELLNNIGSIQPRLAYFIRASEPTTIVVQGTPAPLTWPINRSGFSFVSFPVSDRSEVTLEQYFASASRQPERVFRLQGDQWVPVGNSQAIMRNEIYCVRFSRTPPDFFGPIDFRNLPANEPLAVNTRSQSVSLDYRAKSPESSIGLSVEKISGELDLEIRDGFLAQESTLLSGAAQLNELGPGEAGRLFFQARNFGSALIRLADTNEITAFYTLLEHPAPLN